MRTGALVVSVSQATTLVLDVSEATLEPLPWIGRTYALGRGAHFLVGGPYLDGGAPVPYEDVYSAIGASRASVAVRVYLKTHMAEDTPAERQVHVGKFKLLYPPASCYVGSESDRNSAFTTWDALAGLSAGEYGRGFRNGQVTGYSVHMLTIELMCTPGTHAIGITTVETADGNGLTIAPKGWSRQ